jgi:hypothetical protein
VIERIVRAAPKNEGDAVVEFALAASKIRSVVLLKPGVELQFVDVPKFPDMAPVQVWAWSEAVSRLKARRSAKLEAPKAIRREGQKMQSFAIWDRGSRGDRFLFIERLG